MTIVHWLSHYLVVWMMMVFIGIVAATYWPGRKSSIEKQGRIPFKGDV